MGKDPEKKLKTKQTNLKKYGVEQPIQNKEIKKKMEQTNLKKYGHNNPFRNENIKSKIEQTNLKKYGARRPIQNEEIRRKIEQSVFKRYGVKHTFKNKEIKQKCEQTNIKRYGVSNPSQNKDIQQKIEQTNLERYGVRRPIQNEEIKQKMIETNLERYSVECVFNNEEIREKIEQTNLEKYKSKYHVRKHNIESFNTLNMYEWMYHEYVVCKKNAHQIANELDVNVQTVCNYLHYHDITIIRIRNFSYKAIQWMDFISETENIYIQHAGNIGEYRVPNTNYYVDGYCKETNTIYEFHGDVWHGNPELFKPEEKCHPFNPDISAGELYSNTIERENEIKKLNYNLITIWENNWNKLTRINT